MLYNSLLLGLPKPRPHMLLGIIIRVKPAQVSKEILPVDSSPEVVIKRKKKKKDKKKVTKNFVISLRFTFSALLVKLSFDFCS